MVTNKKLGHKWVCVLLLATVVAWLAGCTPAGPRALLRGKRLIEKGEYADAVEQLKIATSLLSTNALAWNYLGLAYHHAGQPAHAADAYQRALKLSHDLNLDAAVHYNLGCLLLEENRPHTLENARDQLYAYVLHQGNSIEGWLKLGTAQLRLEELPQAEASFKQVLRLNQQNAEAMNDLGVIQLQRHHNHDAEGNFNAALKMQPNYAPALLNLAVTEGYLNNPSASLQHYQDYLALSPRPANWQAVNAIAKQLEQQLAPPPPANIASANPPVTNQTHPAATPTNVSKPETVASISHQAAPPPPPGRPPLPFYDETHTEPEVVKLPASPSVPVAAQTTSNKPANPQPTQTTVASSDVQIIDVPVDTQEEPTTAKRGFLQKLNPMGLFHHKKPETKPVQSAKVTASPDIGEGQALNPAEPTGESQNSSPPARPVVSIARYPYLSPMKPAVGNRAQAERLLAQGVETERDHRYKDAIDLYRAATRVDPSYFEAQSRLGLAALDSGDLPESLRAYEMALAIKPGSFSARYNFGLALKKANYIVDAAQELERLLASNPAESPEHLAMVHLTLANLYAEQFHQPASARAHYLKVLELDPHNSQATSIRYWLQDNG